MCPVAGARCTGNRVMRVPVSRAAKCCAVSRARQHVMIYAFGDYELDTHLYELRKAGHAV